MLSTMPLGFTPTMLTKTEVLALLQGCDDDNLFKQAHADTLAQFSGQVFMRGIIEFSNQCRNDCHYCGLRTSNREVNRYRLTHQQILTAAQSAKQLGMGTIVLQSGDDFRFRMNDIAELISSIKQEYQLAVTLSLGDRSEQELGYWHEAGADRYLLKMETFNPALFHQCRPKKDFQQRLDKIRTLQALGYQTGSGIIVNLPGMTLDMLADDILILTQLQLDMLACGPFVAHPQTPFAAAANGDILLSHRVCAILRLLNPGANIPATSALDALQKGAREQALLRGANVVMPSFTPEQIFADYNIYPGKNTSTAHLTDRVNGIKSAIAAIGLTATSARGDACRNTLCQL